MSATINQLHFALVRYNINPTKFGFHLSEINKDLGKAKRVMFITFWRLVNSHKFSVDRAEETILKEIEKMNGLNQDALPNIRMLLKAVQQKKNIVVEEVCTIDNHPKWGKSIIARFSNGSESLVIKTSELVGSDAQKMKLYREGLRKLT